MFAALVLAFASVALPGPQTPASTQTTPVVADPEAHPDGRASYLGRTVAQTMHWSGAEWLLRATREDEENGELLRHWLMVRPDQSVCDLGCGNGYHTLPLAHAVGAKGHVLAVDVQPEMLKLLAQRARSEDLANVELVEATIDDPRLPAASCDLVLMVDVYHELSHPVHVLSHVREALRPHGRLVLVEFRAEVLEVPIKPEHKMSKAQIICEMAENGLFLVDSFDGLPWQHALAFGRVDEPGPRAAARAVLDGFQSALAGGDARIVEPYFAASVDTGGSEPLRRQDFAQTIAASMKEQPALLAEHARAELRAGANGRVLAHLDPTATAQLWQDRNEITLARDVSGRFVVEAFRAASSSPRPFVAMQTTLGSGPVAERAQLACELGFDGVAWDLDDLPTARRTCEARGADLWSAYAVLDLQGDPTEVAARSAPIRAAMEALAGGPGMLWLALRNDSAKPRDSTGDAAAERALVLLIVDAQATGVEIALYPHYGFWLETAEDALRLCKRIDHPRLGVCFNLCHFLRCSETRDPTPWLREARAKLFAVTLNGADQHGTDWRTLIQPLGKGDLDLRPVLRTLDEIHFEGPIGLQGFGIALPAREELTLSMRAWGALHGK